MLRSLRALGRMASMKTTIKIFAVAATLMISLGAVSVHAAAPTKNGAHELSITGAVSSIVSNTIVVTPKVHATISAKSKSNWNSSSETNRASLSLMHGKNAGSQTAATVEIDPETVILIDGQASKDLSVKDIPANANVVVHYVAVNGVNHAQSVIVRTQGKVHAHTASGSHKTKTTH